MKWDKYLDEDCEDELPKTEAIKKKPRRVDDKKKPIRKQDGEQ